MVTWESRFTPTRKTTDKKKQESESTVLPLSQRSRSMNSFVYMYTDPCRQSGGTVKDFKNVLVLLKFLHEEEVQIACD
jgi:hypothetical protein